MNSGRAFPIRPTIGLDYALELHPAPTWPINHQHLAQLLGRAIALLYTQLYHNTPRPPAIVDGLSISQNRPSQPANPIMTPEILRYCREIVSQYPLPHNAVRLAYGSGRTTKLKRYPIHDQREAIRFWWQCVIIPAAWDFVAYAWRRWQGQTAAQLKPEHWYITLRSVTLEDKQAAHRNTQHGPRVTAKNPHLYLIEPDELQKQALPQRPN